MSYAISLSGTTVSIASPGPRGVGVPTGGTTGQVLAKASATDYDFAWSSASGGLSNVVEDTTPQLGGSLDYDAKDFQAAAALATGKVKPNSPTTISRTGTAKVLAVAIKEYDFQVFADAQQARNFVTNKLVAMADCGDPKLELKALEVLGKHSDIGLFTERSEITVHHTSSSSLENSIKERVKRLMNADITDVLPLDDLDAHLGAVGEGEVLGGGGLGGGGDMGEGGAGVGEEGSGAGGV